MSLADDIINGTYKKKDIKVNTTNTKKETQIAPIKNLSDDIINGTYKKRNININVTGKNKSYSQTTKQTQEEQPIAPLKYVGKKFGTGIIQGTAGIAQGLLTDSANEMQKGKTQDTKTLLNSLINAYAGNDLHNIAQSTLNTIGKGIDIVKDKDKNLLQKATDLNLTVLEGTKALSPMNGIYSAANQVLGKVSDTDTQLLDANEKISKPINEIQQNLAKEGENYGGVTRFLGDAGQSIGNMVPSIVAGAVTKNPNIALGAMGASVKGQATQEALNKGMSLEKATQIGDAKALIEVATEKLSGGAKIFGKGSLDDIAEDLVKKGAKSKFGRFLLTQVANTGGEILEEEISDVLGNAIDKGTTEPDKKIIDGKEALETMGSTAFTTTMLNLLTGGMINDYNQISNDMNQYRDITTREVLNENSQNALHETENIINQNQPTAPINTFNQQQNNVGQNENIEYNQRQVDAPTNVQNLLNNEISTAIQNRTSKGKVSLGRVSNNVVNSVKSLLGIDVTNRTHVLADNDIRHMLNEHGDPKVEAKRGQIAITENDIQKIPDIVNNFDDIVKGNPNRNGETIRYIKSFEDGTTYLVEVVPETSKTLNIKTMWKKPTSLANQQEPSLTSKTQSHSISSTSNNIIPQNNNNMQAQNKSFEDTVFDAMEDYEDDAEVQSPLQDRNINTIGKQIKTNAYQYDNPNVKPYFQEMAQMIGEDLSYISSSDNRNTQKGGGTRLSATTKAIDILHNEQGYSYNQIAQGLQNIINDNGQENNAISKKIELIIDDQLRNGYTNVLGKGIAPNQEYINTISNKQEAPIKQSPIPPINNTQGETVNWNEIERPEGKVRKHYKSIIESSNTTAEAKKIARELIGSDTYVARSNNELLNEADRRINTAEPDTELNKLLSKAMNNEKIKDVDIAVGERLIEYYSKIGDKAHLQDAIHATAMAGTQAGRTVQAMALLNHMTPQGQVVWLDRSINKMNNELQQKYKNRQNVPQFELTPEMQQKIMETTNQEEMNKALDEVYEELGQQVPKTLAEQIDEWRYFSMLANIKTHGRNMIGNFAMGITQRVKNKVAGAIEGTVAQFNPEMERTHTLKHTSKEVKQFAKKDVLNADVQTELGMNENKYTPQSRLQNARKTFKSNTLNNSLGKLFDLNSNLLEVEDNIGLKSMYVNALGEYITANNIDVNNITDAQLQKARKHAIKEAQEATFHQSSALATALNQMGRTSNIKKFALDAAVPFKKTPINVAKTGVQYSPVGLIKSAVFDIGKVRRGNISVNEYIDNISKGLTGTGITFLGYALAQAGILKASGGDDDKKEKYDEEQGKQKYSIEIGGKTATLDWLSPAGIPLFIGAEINQQFNQTKKEKTNKSTDDNETLYQIIRKVGGIGTGLSNIMNPMTEMSMVSGLTSILSSYNKENAVGDVIVNTGKSYINQFVPTALGQLARTTDEYERTTKSTKTGTFEKAADSTINQIKSKVPGLRQTLPIKTDIWGKEIKQSENLPFKAFNNFINPSTIKDVSTNKVDKELNNLYSKTKNGAIIPKAIENKFTIDGTDYRMSNKEYAKYYKNYGKTSYNLIKELISNEDYKSMNTEQKEKAIENVYSYAKEKNKVDYAKANKLKVEPSTLYNTMEDLKKNGGNQSSYLQYIAKTTGIEKESERNKILAKANFNTNTKSIIYRNGTGKDDKFYNLVAKNSNLDINEYLNYKIQKNAKAFESDKNKYGNDISGSAKKKLYTWVNTNITGYENRLLILGYNYKLSNKERNDLTNYINKKSLTDKEAIETFKKLSSNYKYVNGKVYYK